MAKPSKRTRIVGYIRVSSVKQVEEGCSLAAQTAKLRAYALAMDLELVAICEDAGLSAKSLDRPGLSRALAMLEAGDADGILVAKLDRLTRSVKDLGVLIEQHLAKHVLLSVSDSIDTRSAGGRLVLNVLASVSQWEREAIGERTREALAHLKAQGVKLGAPAYEGPAIERAQQLRATGATLREITRVLTQEGHATRKGGPWRGETVRMLLRRPQPQAPASAEPHEASASPR